jgi:PAS domain S-box-containing protein
MLDTQARITYANDHLLALTGWRRDEVKGRNWFELFIPREESDLRAVYERLLAAEPSAAHHVNEIVTRSGARRLIQWNNTVLRSGSGEVVGTASIGEDITDRMLAEQKVRRLNRVYAVLSSSGCAAAPICSANRAASRSRRARSSSPGSAPSMP